MTDAFLLIGGFFVLAFALVALAIFFVVKWVLKKRSSRNVAQQNLHNQDL
ncbi:MAG: hypothetical protein Q4C71_04960 [Microbacteriaceae bacterium]|nr:hypothetical protein [Microbacteriaceae bacterium]